jgi:aspartate-semialdehyde dehydrogenase
VSTYQAASGAGRGAVEQLWAEAQELIRIRGQEKNDIISELPQSSSIKMVLPRQIAFNIFPQVGGFGQEGYTSEEWKTVRETHKIFHSEEIKITATCVRVPVFVGHGEAIYIETEEKIMPEKVRTILKNFSGIEVIDKGENYPMPIDAEGKDEVFIGRVRRDPFIENGMWLWVVSDNLRKGAALNAVQIAECLIKNHK